MPVCERCHIGISVWYMCMKRVMWRKRMLVCELRNAQMTVWKCQSPTHVQPIRSLSSRTLFIWNISKAGPPISSLLNENSNRSTTRAPRDNAVYVRYWKGYYKLLPWKHCRQYPVRAGLVAHNHVVDVFKAAISSNPWRLSVLKQSLYILSGQVKNHPSAIKHWKFNKVSVS